MSVADAIRAFVRPGMHLHFTLTHGRPYGLAHAVIREYWRSSPQFTVSGLSFSDTGALFACGGLARTMITAYVGDPWPSPSPSPLVQAAWSSGALEVEHWTMLSLTQRLWAAAMGLPFVPVRSLRGTSMADELVAAQRARVVADPFQPGSDALVIAPLHPDLTMVHAIASDVEGNAILAAPLGEGALGALAAKGGAVVSTERIVDRDVLRAHNQLVQVPACAVRAVVEMPFGGHPRGLGDAGLVGSRAYGDDYAFHLSFREAERQGTEALEAWVNAWILGLPDHDALLEKLGQERLQSLMQKARPERWSREIGAIKAGARSANGQLGVVDEVTPISAEEMQVIAAARVMGELKRELGLTTILAGVGTANLAAWLCHALDEGDIPVSLLGELGHVDYHPRPGDPFIFHQKNLSSCTATSDILTTLGVLVGRGGCLGALGAAQVDARGGLNTTLIPERTHLFGSGGGNDVASMADAVVVTAALRAGRFPERLSFATSSGERVRYVVTDQGVFEKPIGDHTLRFAAYYGAGPTAQRDSVSAVRAVQELVGWSVEASPTVRAISPPTADEVALLRLFDPFGHFIGQRAPRPEVHPSEA
jgi:acyl CoA:acetate/3-ketoacid CoA transferase alpha subunit